MFFVKLIPDFTSHLNTIKSFILHILLKPLLEYISVNFCILVLNLLHYIELFYYNLQYV